MMATWRRVAISIARAGTRAREQGAAAQASNAPHVPNGRQSATSWHAMVARAPGGGDSRVPRPDGVMKALERGGANLGNARTLGQLRQARDELPRGGGTAHTSLGVVVTTLPIPCR